MQIYFPTGIFLTLHNWSKGVIWLNTMLNWNWGISEGPIAKTVLKDNKYKRLHLTRKYAQIFDLGHNMFIEAHRFPWALPFEKSPLLGTDNVYGQISNRSIYQNSGQHWTSALIGTSNSEYPLLFALKQLRKKWHPCLHPWQVKKSLIQTNFCVMYIISLFHYILKQLFTPVHVEVASGE